MGKTKDNYKFFNKIFIALSLIFVLCTGIIVLTNNENNEMMANTSISQIVSQDTMSENERFSGYIDSLVYGKRNNGPATILAKDQLNDKAQNLYDFLAEKIVGVANGGLSTTKFTVNSSLLSSWGAKTSWTKTELDVDEITSLNQLLPEFLGQFEMTDVVTALLHDYPYELYWFDKTEGVGEHFSGSITTTGDAATITSFVLTFDVSKNYQPSNYNEDEPSVDTSKTGAAQLAVNNARQIVNLYADLTDYQKLVAYKNRICELVSYDHSVLESSYTDGYGDPWQLIYVFDGDAQTNVVCEGYSKAFQYLCDLSTFDSEFIHCYTVTGSMQGATGAGNHMWNVVTMDDELDYIADITNSDDGSIGVSGGLFLSGADSGNLNTGYSFNLSNVVTYRYDSSTTSIWGTDSTSVLNIEFIDYTPDHPIILIEHDDIVYDAQGVIADIYGTSNVDFTYFFDGDTWNEDNYLWEYEWHSDNHGVINAELSSAPVNVGTYWIKVIATNKINALDKIVHNEKFTITKATVQILNVIAQNRSYNGTNIVVITDLDISGVHAGDDVSIAWGSNQGTLSSANAGTYNNVNISGLYLTGNDIENYKLESPQCVVSSNTITISAIEPTVTPDYCVVFESGKTLADTNLNFVATGMNNQVVNGTISWVDEEGNVLSSSTEIEYQEEYKWKFTPTSINYSEVTGSVVLWSETTPSTSEWTITVNVNNQDYGTVSGGGTYQTNQTVTVTAAAKEGYVFVCWKEGENNISAEEEYSFTAHANRTLTAVFESANTETNNEITVEKIVEYMWYVLYALVGLAIISSAFVLFEKKKS